MGNVSASAEKEDNRNPLFDKKERYSNQVGDTPYHCILLSGKLKAKMQHVTISGPDPLFDTPTRLSATLIVGGMAKSINIVLSNATIQTHGTTLFSYGPKVDQFIRSVF